MLTGGAAMVVAAGQASGPPGAADILFAAACAFAAVWIWPAPRAVTRLRTALGAPRAEPAVLPPEAAAHRYAQAGRAIRDVPRRRLRVARRRTAVIDLCDGMGAELAAGRTPEVALASSMAVIDPETATEILAAALGPAYDPGSPAALATWLDGEGSAEPIWEVLERAAAKPGAEGLRLLGACWRIGAERGGTFASVIDGLAGALREEKAQRAEIASQLAGPRATARLLAGLPLLGLAMAAVLGAHPVAFLTGSAAGAGCLLSGCGLDLVGLWWTARISAAAERVG